jgi:ankyrin repeat protein
MKKLSEAICILFLLALMGGCAGALQDAAYKGDIRTMTKLIDDGADINENSAAGPALHYACYTCQLEAVKLLLKNIGTPYWFFISKRN